VWNWEDLDPEEDARRARAREAYAKMYPLNKDDPYGVKRLESCRAQTALKMCPDLLFVDLLAGLVRTRRISK
jgi:hypothetical protein